MELRRTARVVIVRSGKVLLLHHRRRDGTDVWATPGGGLEDGETFEEAAYREAFEETGLAVSIGSCVWRRQKDIRYRGAVRRMDTRFFLASYSDGEPVLSVSDESARIKAAGWWSVAELRSTDAAIEPPQLADLLDTLLRHGAPSPPVDLGLSPLETQLPRARPSA